MYLLINPANALVVESSNTPIFAAADGDYFVSATRHHYDPRPSSGAGVVEMSFPEESFCAYRMAVAGPEKIVTDVSDYDRALTAHLDAEAQTRRYDNRINCALRAGYPGPYQAEGVAFAQWMDACNQVSYQLLADFQAGLIPRPTIAEVIEALPEMVWP